MNSELALLGRRLEDVARGLRTEMRVLTDETRNDMRKLNEQTRAEIQAAIAASTAAVIAHIDERINPVERVVRQYMRTP